MKPETIARLMNALRPFAELLECPEECVTDADGLFNLFFDPKDVKEAQDALIQAEEENR